jgi:hypothetical protein
VVELEEFDISRLREGKNGLMIDCIPTEAHFRLYDCLTSRFTTFGYPTMYLRLLASIYLILLSNQHSSLRMNATNGKADGTTRWESCRYSIRVVSYFIGFITSSFHYETVVLFLVTNCFGCAVDHCHAAHS